MLIILDRDGVINEDSDQYIKTPEEWHAITGSLSAIAKLNRAGHRVVVASNQSGLARGYFTAATLEAIHKKMHQELLNVQGHLDGIYYCPHHPDENCACRKPKPGLLKKIASDLNDDLSNAIMIGDTFSDFQTAQAAGVKFILVLTGKGLRTAKQYSTQLHHIIVADNLLDAVEHFI